MFVLKKTQEYDWPVIIEIPVDGGTFENKEITARFRVMDGAAVEKILATDSPFTPPSSDKIVSFLTEVVIGWSGVADEGGTELAFSDENLKALLGIPYVRNAVFTAYGESIAGSKEKNSERPRASG